MSRDPTIEFYHRESDAQRAEIDSLLVSPTGRVKEKTMNETPSAIAQHKGS